MRKSLSVLSLLALVALPIAADAGPPPRRGVPFRQKMPSFKPAKVQPNDPALVAAQGQALGRLKVDLDAIPKGAATKEQGEALRKSLLAVVDGASRPKPEAVKKLTTDLADALAKRGGEVDTVKLAQDLKVVMNTAYKPPVNVDRALKSTLAQLQAAGVDEAGAKAIADDLNAIVAQLKSSGAGMIK